MIKDLDKRFLSVKFQRLTLIIPYQTGFFFFLLSSSEFIGDNDLYLKFPYMSC